jgi:hypothetical protein
LLNISAFASLAQLGSGIALALAIFVEPIMLRDRRFREALSGALKLLPRATTTAIEDKRNDILMKIINLNTDTKTAQVRSKWPLLMMKVGAGINFIVLLAATVCPDAEVSFLWMWLLLIILILPIAIGFIWLSLLARAVIKDPR